MCPWPAGTVQYTLSTVHFHVGVQSGSMLWGEGMTGVSTHICAYLEKAGHGSDIISRRPSDIWKDNSSRPKVGGGIKIC